MTGAELKAEALETHEAGNGLLLLRARRAMLHVLLEQGTATADDVRNAVELPAGVNPKVFGTVPGVLVRAGIIRKAGSANSERPLRHAAPITVWELGDAGAAERWLMDHPDLDDPLPVQQELFPKEKAGAATPANTRETRHATRIPW